MLKTDLLWEGTLQLIKEKPLTLFRLPFWLCKGRAAFKIEIAKRVVLDPSLLPYRREVLASIFQARTDGRRTVLVSAAHALTAEHIAQHLACFDEVIATRGSLNLKGEAKRVVLEERFGRKQFDYIGDAASDLPVWASARQRFVVTNNSRLSRRAESAGSVTSIRTTGLRRWPACAQAMRLHQSAKNLLVFVPIVTGHRVLELAVLFKGVLAFLAFSFVSSSIYLINDLLDLPADRAHPRKRTRPFAAGDLDLHTGMFLAAILMVAGFGLAAVAGLQSLEIILISYFVMSFAYSYRLKRIAIMDVLILAGFYALRIFAGGAATGIRVSQWLLAFAMFFFFSLALVKRYSELLPAGKPAPASGRGYVASDLPQIATFGITSGCVSALVLVLYVMSPEVTLLYHRPNLLLFLCPLLLYWIGRIWMLATRGLVHEDPIIFALRDRPSYCLGLLAALWMYFATL